MIGTSPVRRRVLGAALRRYREKQGCTLQDAAQALECDRSKISRIETGQRGIPARDLRALLDEYGADEDERHILTVIADPVAARGWWRQFSDVLPEAYRDYLILEAAASRILAYESQRVPALLQTGPYACAIAAADPAVPARLRDRATQATLAHQEMIRSRGRKELAVVIGEGVLHQLVGGVAVMREQFRRLAAASQGYPGATIQVLPFTAGAHCAIGTGPVTILGFAQRLGLDMVHLASLPGGVFLDGPQDVTRYHEAFQQLQVSALPPAESARLLQQMAGS